MGEYRNIFFDFDGVILESVKAKTNAFIEMYRPYGNTIMNKVLQHHIENGGISRFEKFKYYEEVFLGKQCSRERIDELAKEFSLKVKDQVISSKAVEGVIEFLENYHKKLDFWIITGTPTDEILEITKARNLQGYFKGIYGSPKNKKHWTEYIIDLHGLDRSSTLFLGDATTDYEAAKHSGLHFGLRQIPENEIMFKDYMGLKFTDFYQLEKELFL
ncbi:MAG: hypothetical protein CL868_07100 [Cytophagaceae bacterium]|nr:hypothetical protein [Cytophagaceae bacterium]|tara:strand:- start:54038 stop:54685 length:648 start_codon:yes stop_codon:yes gene_type:complete